MRYILAILFSVAVAVMLCACSEGTMPESEEYLEDYSSIEWISPDGVHYWRFCDFYDHYLVPRYDHNGHLVID